MSKAIEQLNTIYYAITDGIEEKLDVFSNGYECSEMVAEMIPKWHHAGWKQEEIAAVISSRYDSCKSQLLTIINKGLTETKKL